MSSRVAATSHQKTPSALDQRIGRKIRKIRIRRKLSQCEVARRAGISNAMVWMIESGRRGFTVDTLVAIAGAIGVRPSLFLGKRMLTPEEEPCRT